MLSKLPAGIQNLAQAAFRRFEHNPLDPALENHPLQDTRRGKHRKGSRAVSVTARYRAIYVVDDDTNVWYWIGSHEDYNDYTGRKQRPLWLSRFATRRPSASHRACQNPSLHSWHPTLAFGRRLR